MKLILKFTFLSMILLLVACQKENTSKAGSLTEANRAKLERLNQFNQILINHHENQETHARNSQTFTPAETRWALESVMNINHAFRPDQFENLIISRHTLEVPLTNNAVTEADFYDAYMSLYDSLVVAFEAALIPEKYFIGMILDFDTLMSDKARFKVFTQIASESQMMAVCDDRFDRDYYIGAYLSCDYNEYTGSCDGIVDNTNGICLMNTYLNEYIQEDLNDLNTDPQNFPWFGGFIGDVVNYVDDVYYSSYPNLQYDPLEDDLIRQHLMIHFLNNDLEVVEGMPGFLDLCISKEDLDWFLCNHYNIAKSITLQQGYHLAMVKLGVNFSGELGNFPHGSYMKIYEGVPFFTNISPRGGFVIGPAIPHADLMQSVVIP